VLAGDASLAHHTQLLSGGGARFLLGSSRDWFIAYLVSGDGSDDFALCTYELGIAPLGNSCGHATNGEGQGTAGLEGCAGRNIAAA
jgi:hypothetical protein